MADESTPGDMAASIMEMQALLLGTETIEDFLAELAGLAVATVSEGLSCGITLQPNGRPLTVASTDALAAQVDEVQYGLDQGPCLHAMRTGILVSIVDLTSDQRWAGYAALALQHGIRSSLSLPLSSGSVTIGAFNLYSRVAGSFGPAATSRAERFAQNASGALSIAVRLADHVALTDQLRTSLASRAVIDQAIGVLMGQRRITAAEAFAILRTTSQNRNIKLQAFSAQIVEGASGQPPLPPPFDPPGPPR
ncbi:MAG: GAF and ANTAR domain-containing protein [Streptosporangiaceae bacterium]|jgi:GAF domain-containing protein